MKASTFYRAMGFSMMILGVASASARNLNVGFGFNYSKGEIGGGPIYMPALGAPAMGYGAGALSLGGIGGACAIIAPPCAGPPCLGGGGGPIWGPGVMPPLPSMPAVQPPIAGPMPPPMPIVPPHMMGGWGPGFGALPHAGLAPGACGLPCGAGLMPMPIGPVAGGPAMGLGLVGAATGGTGADPGFRVLGGGSIIEVGSRNEWEKSDTDDIVWATAVGMGMQATNVFPVTPPRYAPTLIPSFYNFGDRNPGFIPRPHGTP